MFECKTISSVLDEATSSRNGVSFIEGTNRQSFMSYKELRQNASLFLERLYSAGVTRGDYLIIFTPNNREFLVAFWAAILGRIVPVPVSYGRSNEFQKKLDIVSKQLRRSWVFDGGDENIEGSLYLCNVVSSASGDETSSSNQPAEPSLPQNEYALIQFSSGSTGDPKGVALTHENLLTNIKDIIERSRISKSDSMLCWMPLTHDMGLIGMHLVGVFANINQSIMPTALFIRRPILWMELAAKLKATLLYSPNFGYHYFLAVLDKDIRRDWDLRYVRIIYNGAEPISSKLCKRFLSELATYGLKSSAIAPAYGMAEASVAISLAVDEDLREYFLDRASINIGAKVRIREFIDSNTVSFVDVGAPLSSCKVRITNDLDELMDEETIGHIQITGRNVMEGYINSSDQNRSNFTADGWLRTGDLGLIIGGRLIVTGRSKNLIILNGQNFYPYDIEKIVIDAGLSMEGQVAACGVRIDEEEKLVVFIRMANAVVDPNLTYSIRETITSKLGINVFDVSMVKRIPKTTSGKVQYNRLAQDFVDGYDRSSTKQAISLKSKDDLEAIIIQTLSYQLGEYSSSIDPDSNIFAIGLNSLQLSQFISRLSRTLADWLSITDVLNHPTVERLAAFLVYKNPRLVELVTPVEEQYFYSLTKSQRDLYILSQLDVSGMAYNITTVKYLAGTYDYTIVRKCIELLTARHESLRSNFAGGSNLPYLRIRSLESRQISFVYKDISTEQERDKLIRDIVSQEARIRFDLRQDNLFRVVFVKMADENFQIVFTAHHLIVDGWSMHLLAREFEELYSSCLSDGLNTQSPEMRIQYKDYIGWKHRSSGLTKNNSTSEWYPFPEIRLFNSRPQRKTYLGGSISMTVPEKHVRQLQFLSVSHQITETAVVLAVVSLLVHRYSLQKEFTIGMPAANRMHADLEPCVGYFIKTLAIPVNVDAHQEFISLARQLNEQIILRSNEDADFNIESKDLSFDLARGSTFNILVVYQNFRNVVAGPGSMNFEEHFNGTCISDLYFEFLEADSGLALNLRYSTDLFTMEDIEGMLSYIQSIMDYCFFHAAEPVVHALRPPSLVQQTLDVFSNKSANSNNNPFESIVSSFENIVTLYPDNPAIIEGTQRITYKELNQQSNRLAHYLLSVDNAQANAVIGVYMDQSTELIIAILAILKIGSAYLPFSTLSPPSRIAAISKDCNLSILLTKSDMSADLRGISEVDIISIDRIPTSGSGEENLGTTILASDLAYVIYTSGTTGVPKGVMVEHGNIASIAACWRVDFALRPDDVILQLANPSFDVFTGDLCKALLNGGALIPFSAHSMKSVEHLVDTLVANRVSIVESTPGLLIPVLEFVATTAKDIECLRLAIIGSDTCPIKDFRSIVEHFDRKIRIVNSYGTTEATVDSSYFDCTENLLREMKTMPIGRPMDNSSFLILDDNKLEVPMGVPGELYIGGKGVGRGYVNDPTLTDERFLNLCQRYYKTGDMARWLPDGNIDFLGRKDTQVKIRGYRVDLSEIETSLIQTLGIENAIVFYQGGERSLAAYLLTKAPIESDASAISFSLRNSLPEYMIPSDYYVISTIPLTANGKLDRKAIPTMPARRIRASKQIPETYSPIEADILEQWKKILVVDTISIYDNFFDNGGNSLKALQLLAVLNKRYQTIELRHIFTYPNISELSRFLTGKALKEDLNHIACLESQQSYPTSDEQKSMWTLCQDPALACAYNMSSAFSLKTELNVDQLNEAFINVVQRHDILRTTFHFINGDLRQRMHWDIGSDAFELFEERSYSFDEIIRRHASHKFQLEKWPLFKVSVCKMNNGSVAVVVTMHHIITDERSKKILIDQWLSGYMALRNGNDFSRWGGDSLQYKDYVIWKNDQLGSDKLDAQQDYWRNRLMSNGSAFELRSDSPRRADRSYQSRSASIRFTNDECGRIKGFCRDKHTSPLMLYFASVNILYYKYTNAREIIIGLPAEGRFHHGLSDVVGNFVNTLPILTEIDENQTFFNVLKEVQEQILDAVENQIIPFAHIVKRSPVPRAIGKNPLFETVVQYIEDIDENFHNELCPIEVPTFYNPFEVEFVFSDSGVEIKYNTALFDQQRMERMLGHLKHLIFEALATDSNTVRQLSIIPEQEAAQITSLTNATVFQSSNDSLVINTIERTMAMHPHRTALRFEERTLTYQELEAEVESMANRFKDLSIHPGEGVVLLLPRGLEFVIAVLAIMKVRAYFIPIEVTSPEGYRRSIIEDARPSAVISLNSDGSLRCSKAFDITGAGQTHEANVTQIHDKGSSRISYVLYTSGSTGMPKGVIVENRPLNNYLEWCNRFYFNEKSGFNFSLLTSVSFDLSYTAILSTLYRGDCLTIYPEGDNIKALGESFAVDSGIDVVKITPSHVDLLASLAIGKTSVKLAIIGGEALLKKHITALHELNPEIKIYNEYGPTEATIGCTVKLVNPEVDITIGRPIDNTFIYVLDSDLHLKPIDEFGEIFIGGDCLARGYLNSPTLTNERFINFFDGKKSVRLYRSGDIGRWRPNGDLEYLGRNDRQVKVKGHRVELGAIEAILSSFQGVKHGVVLLQSINGLPTIVGYYTSQNHVPLSSKLILQYMSKALPVFATPSRLVYCQDMPLTKNGKINYDELAKIETPIEEKSNGTAGRSTVHTITGIWKFVLGASEISEDQKFFEAGGDSFKLVQLHLLIEDHFPGKVTLTDLFTHATIAQQASLIEPPAKVMNSGETLNEITL